MDINIIRQADWLPTLSAMRLPMNGKSNIDEYLKTGKISKRDLNLMKRLHNAGPDHAKSLRGAWVTFEIEAPRYWWSEMDTYCVGKQPLSSTSTMHKLTSTPIHEGMFQDRDVMLSTINVLNNIRLDKTLSETERLLAMKKRLPESFLQTRVVQINYPSLTNIYYQRNKHRLPEWFEFTQVIESLPYFEELIKLKNDDKK